MDDKQQLWLEKLSDCAENTEVTAGRRANDEEEPFHPNQSHFLFG